MIINNLSNGLIIDRTNSEDGEKIDCYFLIAKNTIDGIINQRNYHLDWEGNPVKSSEIVKMLGLAAHSIAGNYDITPEMRVILNDFWSLTRSYADGLQGM